LFNRTHIQSKIEFRHKNQTTARIGALTNNKGKNRHPKTNTIPYVALDDTSTTNTMRKYIAIVQIMFRMTRSKAIRSYIIYH
jgi:hypothetical protein